MRIFSIKMVDEDNPDKVMDFSAERIGEEISKMAKACKNENDVMKLADTIIDVYKKFLFLDEKDKILTKLNEDRENNAEENELLDSVIPDINPNFFKDLIQVSIMDNPDLQDEVKLRVKLEFLEQE